MLESTKEIEVSGERGGQIIIYRKSSFFFRAFFFRVKKDVATEQISM